MKQHKNAKSSVEPCGIDGSHPAVSPAFHKTDMVRAAVNKAISRLRCGTSMNSAVLCINAGPSRVSVLAYNYETRVVRSIRSLSYPAMKPAASGFQPSSLLRSSFSVHNAPLKILVTPPQKAANRNVSLPKQIAIVLESLMEYTTDTKAYRQIPIDWMQVIDGLDRLLDHRCHRRRYQ